MKSQVINRNSTYQDIQQLLTGSWTSTRTGEGKKWTVTRTPFFVHCEAVLEAGQHQLPEVPKTTKALYWTAKDSYGSTVLKAGQQTFSLPRNAYCEYTMFVEPEG